MRIHKGYTTSDLHLLTNRSSADRLMPRLHRAAAEGDLLVLNGDIFDFQWSVYPNLGESLDYAKAWIGRLARRHRHCRFVFIMGNHDSLPAYGDLLDELSGRYDNLAWEPYYLQLGTSVFLHGDVGSSASSSRSLAAYRQRWHGRRRQPWVHKAYLACTHIGIPRMICECRPARRHMPEITTYLKTELGPRFTELHDVYFGHTHKPLTNYRWDGLRFHNTGAAIHRVRSRIQTFTYDPADLQNSLAASADRQTRNASAL